MIYAYRCGRCKHDLLRNVPVVARDNQKCECGGRLRRDDTYKHIHITIPANYWSTQHQIAPQDSRFLPHPERNSTL